MSFQVSKGSLASLAGMAGSLFLLTREPNDSLVQLRQHESAKDLVAACERVVVNLHERLIRPVAKFYSSNVWPVV